MSVDPLAPAYPSNSPYAFAENRVIDGNELEGLEHENRTLNAGLNYSSGATFTGGGTFSNNTLSAGSTFNYNFSTPIGKQTRKSRVTFLGNFSTSIDLYGRRNNANYIGFGLDSKLTFGLGFGTRKVKDTRTGLHYMAPRTYIFYSAELRLYTGHFSAEGNISKAVTLITPIKSKMLQITIGNDYSYLGDYGFDGATGKFTTATDGGLTMNVVFGLYNADFTKGWMLRGWGMTPHRKGTKGNYSLVPGDPGDWGLGVYETDRYPGDYYSAISFSRYRYFRGGHAVSAGVGIWGGIGGEGQDWLHINVSKSPQFRGWDEMHIADPYIEFSYHKTLGKRKRK